MLRSGYTLDVVRRTPRRQPAILAAYRTRRGEWYAVVTSFRREHGRERVTEFADLKVKTQKEAIAAGVRLMTEKAHWLSPDVWLSVAIVSALEWQEAAIPATP